MSSRDLAYPLADRGRDGIACLEMGDEGTYNALRAGDGGSSRSNLVLIERERERAPRLASSSQMQRVASTVTTGTGQRMDPDTESLVVT